MVVHLAWMDFMKSCDPLIFTQYRAVKSLDSVSHGAGAFGTVFRHNELVFVFV